MTEALGYLRKKGILYNDIKPGNILSGLMVVVLIDFGLGSEDGSRASAGGILWYVLPEYLTAG
jgi:serine/threonine protein kinase